MFFLLPMNRDKKNQINQGQTKTLFLRVFSEKLKTVKNQDNAYTTFMLIGLINVN